MKNATAYVKQNLYFVKPGADGTTDSKFFMETSSILIISQPKQSLDWLTAWNLHVHKHGSLERGGLV